MYKDPCGQMFKLNAEAKGRLSNVLHFECLLQGLNSIGSHGMWAKDINVVHIDRKYYKFNAILFNKETWGNFIVGKAKCKHFSFKFFIPDAAALFQPIN